MENDLYLIIVGVVDDKIAVTEPAPLPENMLSADVLERIRQEGLVSMCNTDFTQLSAVSTYNTLMYLREFFLLGALSCETDQQEWLRKYLLYKYDLSVDYYDEKKEDPVIVDMPYEIERKTDE